MIIYDKAAWHIDAGMNEDEVINRLKKVFEFLNAKDLLSDEGKEEYELGIDDSCSLNEKTVDSKGNEFLNQYYDEVIDNTSDTIIQALEEKYQLFTNF